jgi:flagellar biosynthesis protein FlhG
VTDAYALIKMIEHKNAGKDIRIVVNQAANQEEAALTFSRLRKVAIAYLQRDLAYAGFIPRDRAVADAVRKRVPFAQSGDGPASQALRTLAMKLKSERWKG